MNGPQLQQLWPAQERVLSPVALVVIGAPAALVGGALLSGDPRLLALALAGLAAAIGDQRFFTVAWVARLDERFAMSTFVERRLRRRARRRDRIRRLLPAAKAVARRASILVAVAASVAIAAGLAGFVPPASDPPLLLELARVMTYTLSLTAFASFTFVAFAKPLVRDWDEAAGSAPCGSAVVSGAQLASRLEADAAVTAARVLGVLAFAVAALS
jgi:hypothetical protein